VKIVEMMIQATWSFIAWSCTNDSFRTKWEKQDSLVWNFFIWLVG